MKAQTCPACGVTFQDHAPSICPHCLAIARRLYLEQSKEMNSGDPPEALVDIASGLTAMVAAAYFEGAATFHDSPHDPDNPNEEPDFTSEAYARLAESHIPGILGQLRERFAALYTAAQPCTTTTTQPPT